MFGLVLMSFHFIHIYKPDEFIQSNRKRYIIDNGFISEAISMERLIFQGCPISPILF